MRKLSWTPVRYGAHAYCSPACGRGCTREEHKAATDLGNAIAKKLGKGWKVEVHENLGWFTRVFSPCGRLRVSPSLGLQERYTAFLGESGKLGGLYTGQGPTPLKAVQNAVLAAKDAKKTLDELVDGLEEYL